MAIMRILFVGETWQGSSARSMREALALQSQVVMSDVGEDHFLPSYRGLPLRIVGRLLRPLQRRELANAVFRAKMGFIPDVVLVYKGSGIGAGLLHKVSRTGIPLVNIFPDYSPHAYGRRLRKAMACYDMVISTKPFHPDLWRSAYGYHNPCVFVPHGYDPQVHYWGEPSPSDTVDVALCCTWRPEYHRFMRAFAAALGDDRVLVAIGGPGWSAHRGQLPRTWEYVGPKTGRAYGEFLRSARIVIAPVNREVVVGGIQQHGDEDTTRTYELAAAQCFFLHQRTDYVATVYDEQSEVPFWRDAAELAGLVRRWLPDEMGRRAMAANAHARAVPAYSIPQRAVAVLQHVERLIKGRKASGAEV